MASTRIAEFDTWRSGYGQATVRVLVAGTSTLAAIYADEDLTDPVSNPVTLIERVDSNISYGRFAEPIYVGVPYELEINSVDRTGVSRPGLTTLEAEDASLATVIVAGGSVEIELEDHLGRRIDVRDYGQFLAVGEIGASTATNTATLTTAIGVAGGRGGGYVEIPAGTYQVSTFTLPAGVVLRGEARDASILQSTQAGNVAVIAGNNAGFSRITLDGISQVNLSVGVFAENRDRIVIDDVLIKRFETGLQLDGGMFCEWRNLTISDCDTGYKGYATDDDLSLNHWLGGAVELCNVIGIDLRYDGEACTNNTFTNITFDTNTGTAVRIEGALATALRDCSWFGNTTNLAVLDDSIDHQVTGLELTDGAMNTGQLSFAGLLENVALRRMRLTDIDVAITTPINTILIEDCEESGVAITGDTTNWLRHETSATGGTFGLTTSTGATKAWAITLNPGDHVFLTAKVIGRQVNAVQHAFYFIAVSARRPGASLAYDTQTGNFTAGNTITGGTSGASARIQADTDGGATGTLTLIDIVGNFVDNEIITDGAGGSATCNGTLSFSNAALVGTVTALRAAQETNAAWDATFAANGDEIELQVTGAASARIEWTSDVTVTRN